MIATMMIIILELLNDSNSRALKDERDRMALKKRVHPLRLTTVLVAFLSKVFIPVHIRTTASNDPPFRCVRKDAFEAEVAGIHLIRSEVLAGWSWRSTGV